MFAYVLEDRYGTLSVLCMRVKRERVSPQGFFERSLFAFQLLLVRVLFGVFSRGDGCWQCLFCDAVSVLLWVWPGCCLGAADLCARAVVAAIACLAMQPDAVVGAGQGAVVSASQGAVECAQGAALGCPKLSHYRGRDHKRWLGWFLVSTFPCWTSHPFAWHELLRSTCRCYATHVLRSCPSSSMSG